MTTKKDKDTPAEPVRIFDVAKPGTLPPADATTRPVIVTNRVVMRDPMMAPPANPSQTPTAESTAAQPLATKIVIQPLAEQTTTAKDVSKGDTAKADVDADGIVDKTAGQSPGTESSSNADKLSVNSGSPAPSRSAETVATTPTSSDLTNTGQSLSTPGQNAETVDPDKLAVDQESAELEASAKMQDELDTLVDEKTYFLPINSVEKRRSHEVYFFSFLLILLLAAAWLNIALDAGLIHIDGVHSLTHFFRAQ